MKKRFGSGTLEIKLFITGFIAFGRISEEIQGSATEEFIRFIAKLSYVKITSRNLIVAEGMFSGYSPNF
jgi:hypothetical protein